MKSYQKTYKYLNSPLEFLMFSQESFRFHQWCSKFGTGIEHGLAIPNPSDHLPKKTRVNEQYTETSLYFRWLSSILVHSANFVNSRAHFLNSSFVARSLRKHYRMTMDLYFRWLSFLFGPGTLLQKVKLQILTSSLPFLNHYRSKKL